MKEVPMRVLLVEDNVSEAAALCGFLIEAPNTDVDLVHVGSLEEGKTIAAFRKIDVILLDLFLPDSSGLQSIISMNDVAPSVPIVALTSVSDNGLSLEAVRVGAQDYLVKGEMDSRLLARALRYAIERKQAQEQLRQSEEHFRSLIENSLDVITILKQDGTIRYASPSVKRVLGYLPKELVKRNAFELVHPEDAFDLRSLFLRIVQTPGFVGFAEFRFRRKDGSWCNLEAVGKFLKDDSETEGVVVNSRDITERRQAEGALREMDEQYRRIVETAQEGIWMIDAQNKTSFVNKKMAEMLGVTVDDMMRTPLFEFMDEEGRAVAAANIERRTSEQHELKFRRKDGADLWALLSTNPIFDDEGRYAGALAMVTDITQRKKDEAQLLTLSRAVEQSPTSIVITDTSGGIEYVNPKFTQITGYSAEEVVGKNPRVLKSGKTPPEEYKHLWETITSGAEWQGEFLNVRKDGTTFWEFASISPVRNAAGTITHFVAVKEDITERKRAEEKLRHSEERYRLLFEENLTGNFVSTPDGVLLSCNMAFARIFGFASVQEAMQSNVKLLYPEDSQREALMTQLLKKKRIENYEQVLRRRDGTLIHAVENVIGAFDEQGELVEIKGYLFDDTKRKLLEEQMIQMQKMESIGTLAGGIAHDFNNILGIILGHSTMLDALVDNPDKLSKSIGTINKAVERGSGLVRQILTFARKTNVLFEPVRLNDLISEIEKMLEGTFPKTIEISLQLEKNLPFIDADRTQLHQTLLNLCVNARDAMPDGGTLMISTSNITGGQLRERIRDAAATEYVHVCVSDTGTGMDETAKQRMFEPFFTTKEMGKGTGLGLSVVYGIMKSHHGYIDVETARGHGATFHLYFPVPGINAESKNTDEEKNSESAGGPETILFVEDEEMLRELVSNLLQAKGYGVLTAADGLEAVAVYTRKKDEIALVLTDMGLPKMSGLAMVKRMRELNPTVKVILASGYLPPEDKPELERIDALEFIEKPYLPDDLFRKIREVIDGQASAQTTS